MIVTISANLSRPLKFPNSLLALCRLIAYSRRRNSRLTFKGAITATAHKLARYVYAMLKHGEAYVSRSLEEYEAATQEWIERTLRKKARALGYDLVPR